MADASAQPNSETPSMRTTRPGIWQPFVAGGFAAIPRRADLRNTYPAVATADQLKASAISNPLRVLGLLADVDPLVAKSQRNTLTLTCAASDISIIAVRETTEGAGDDRRDAEGTDELQQLWVNALPTEIGDLKAFRKALTLQAKKTGLLFVEVVPGPVGSGIAEIWPVDSLTIQFGRSSENGRAIPRQNQGGKPVDLNPDFMIWQAIDADVDNPYGRPIDSAVLPASLANMAFRQDVRDAVHNSAWKRLVYKYSLKALYSIATELLKLPEESTNDAGETIFPAADWVKKQTAGVKEYLGGLKADDNLVADSSDNGGVDVVEGADMAGVEPIISASRLDVIQALGETPTMMGVEGASFNFGSVAWAVQAQSLEDIRDDVLSVIKRVSDLHFRLKGSPLKCEIIVKPIRTTDALVEAQARAQEIRNHLLLVAAGFETPEAACLALTEHGVADDAVAVWQTIFTLCNSKAAGGDSAGTQQPAGNTAEENKASKGASK